MSTETQIKCPSCGFVFEPGEAIGESIRAQIRGEEHAKLAAKLEDLDSRSELVKQREDSLLAQRENLNKLVDEKVQVTLESRAPKFREQIEAEVRARLVELQGDLGDKEKRLHELESSEIELRQKNRDLQEANRLKDIEVQRLVDIEREKMSRLSEEEKAAAIALKEKELTELRGRIAVLDQAQKEAKSEFEMKQKELEERSEFIVKREKELVIERDSFEKLLAQRVQTEVDTKKPELLKQVESSFRSELIDLKNQLSEREKKVSDLEGSEIQLRQKNRELAEANRQKDLEVQRRVDSELEKVVAAKHEESNVLLSQKDKQIDDLRNQIGELQKRAEQLPQKLQGEAAEVRLEELLKLKFPQDSVVPVASGARGADVIQTVVSGNGSVCGTILWESKDTKNWSDNWIKKAKDDQIEAKADLVIICSSALPKEVETFDYRSGVWVTSHLTALAICLALRHGLMELSRTKQAQEGQSVKAELVYNYLIGNEFRQRFGVAVETFVKMTDQLRKEKNAMARIWSERQSDLDRVLDNLSSLYGGLQSVVGASLPTISALSLEAPPDSSGARESLGPPNEVGF